MIIKPEICEENRILKWHHRLGNGQREAENRHACKELLS